MGAVVLAPQDYLSSPHNRQNSCFTSPRSNRGISFFQAAMAISPTAEDPARQKHSGRSPPGDGLLPIPPIHGETRIMSKKSSPRKASSPLYPSPVQKIRPGPSSRSKGNLSRSASAAILPTPLAGSPPPLEGLLKGRRPFTIVEGNGPGSNNDFVLPDPFKKTNGVRIGVRKGLTAANNHVPNEKGRRNFDKLKSTFKVLQNTDGGVPQYLDVRSRRSQERSNSAKISSELSVIAESPVVTILQRPETQEAAAELFAKFFTNGSEQASIPTNEGVEVVSWKSAKSCVVRKEKDHDNQAACAELSDSEASDKSSYGSGYSPFLNGIPNVKEDVEMLPAAPTQGNTGPDCVTPQLDEGVSKDTKGLVLEPNCEEFATWERWAGPSYINSPPPSALPFPRFSKRHLKLVKVDDVHDNHIEDMCNQVLASPTSTSPLYASLGRRRPLNINLDAVATATKDLKRILNLDLCRV